MNRINFYLIIFLIFTTISCQKRHDNIKVADGVLDLSNWDGRSVIDLSGNWLAVIDRFVDKFITTSDDGGSAVYVSPIETWSRVRNGNHYGEFSYILQIKNAPDNIPLTLFIPKIRSFVRVIIDGEVVRESGDYNPQKNLYRMGKFPLLITRTTSSKDYNIIINVANFNNHKTGFRFRLKLGSQEAVNFYYYSGIMLQVLLVGGLFSLGLFHLSLFIYRRKNISSLYFALITILYAFRSTTLDFTPFTTIFLSVPSIVIEKIEFLTILIPLIILPSLLYHTIGYRVFKQIDPIYKISFSILSLILIFTPYSIFNRFFVVIFFLGIGLAIALMITLILKIQNREYQYYLMVLGVGILVFTLLNDMFVNYELYYFYQLASYGIFGFVFSYSFFIFKQISDSYEGVLSMKTELNEKNTGLELNKHDLELKIAIRILELENKNKELESTLENIRSTKHYIDNREKLRKMGHFSRKVSDETKQPLEFIHNFSVFATELTNKLTNECTSNKLVEPFKNIMEISSKILKYSNKAIAVSNKMSFTKNDDSNRKVVCCMQELIEDQYRYTLNLYHKEMGYLGVDLIKDFKEKFSDSQIPVIPTEVGRAISNIFHNSFYAMHRKKLLGDLFRPQVKVYTNIIGDSYEIKIRDNGIGIPDNCRNDLFVPFYTTKPAGEGIGLGLTIAYDIIVNFHKGNIIIDSVEGEFTEVIVIIPINWETL